MRIGWLDGIRGHYESGQGIVGGKLAIAKHGRIGYVVIHKDLRWSHDGAFHLTIPEQSRVNDITWSIIKRRSRLTTAITTL